MAIVSSKESTRSEYFYNELVTKALPQSTTLENIEECKGCYWIT